MELSTGFSDSNDHLANLKRLVATRWGILVAATLLTALAPPLLDLALATAPLFAVIGVAAAFNLVIHLRLRTATAAGSGELVAQLIFDIAALAALCFFSGGAANPLVSLLLLPVAFAALSLPGLRVLAVGLLALGAYSLLMFVYIPLPLADAARAARLHLLGMWLTFAASAALMGWLVVRMTAQIRQRDAELASAREQALRDERVLAMGTLAAGAAHELGTPLGTMALLAGELERDPALPAPLKDDIALIRRQVAACKEIITGLSRRAGAERLESVEFHPVDLWLESVRQRWHALRPRATSRLLSPPGKSAPRIAADPTLEQALLNLLNNAARAADDREILLAADWDAQSVTLEVRDSGPGFPDEVLARGGKSAFPAHPAGSGIGLMLTAAAVERLGGRLILTNPAGGGAVARLELPRTQP